jgi:hypothetical protein
MGRDFPFGLFVLPLRETKGKPLPGLIDGTNPLRLGHSKSMITYHDKE